MSEQIGQWRASYAPGKWIVLSGPTSLVIMQPAPARVSAMINGFWEVVLRVDSLDQLVGELARYNVERMPDFAAFFWNNGEMRSLVRGSLEVIDADSGDVIARGHGVQTWTETGLGHIRRVRVEMEDLDTDDLLKLPLVVGAATACVVTLDATESARVASPQPMPAPTDASLAPLTFEPVASVVPVTVPSGDTRAEAAPAAADDNFPRTELLLPDDLPDFDDEPRRGHDGQGAATLPFGGDEGTDADDAEPERARFLHPVPALDDASGPGDGARFSADEADEAVPEDGFGFGASAASSAPPPGGANPFGSPFDREYAGQPGDPALAGAGSSGVGVSDLFQPRAPEPGGSDPFGAPNTPQFGGGFGAPPVPPGPPVPAPPVGGAAAFGGAAMGAPAPNGPGGSPFGGPMGQPSPFAPPQGGNDQWAPLPPQNPQNQQVPTNQPGPDFGGGEGQILGMLCAMDHPNPPDAQRCRRCGGPLQGQPRMLPQPVLGLLRPSNGAPIDIDRTVLIGRSPQANQVAREQLPKLLTVQSPSHDISRTHLQVSPDGWELVATDLHSTNGTFLIRPGQPEPERMQPGEPIRVFPGCLLDLGDGVTILVDHPA